MGTDYLDVLLLHRPDPLMEPEEIAEAFGRLKSTGKVRYFGVSNMNVGQIRFLQQALPEPLVVNQLEMSLARLDWLNEGVHVNRDGRPLDGEPEHIRKTAECVQRLARQKETSPEAIALGWLMKHPAMIQPVIRTANPDRIKACRDAEHQSELMTRDEWYQLYVTARSQDLP